MTDADPEIYPLHILSQAQTWDEWVRLPIATVHTLQQQTEYYGIEPSIYCIYTKLMEFRAQASSLFPQKPSYSICLCCRPRRSVWRCIH
jgi:hypothetical protein